MVFRLRSSDIYYMHFTFALPPQPFVLPLRFAGELLFCSFRIVDSRTEFVALKCSAHTVNRKTYVGMAVAQYNF